MREVTDPAILEQLNGGDLREVTDPDILAQLNGKELSPPSAPPEKGYFEGLANAGGAAIANRGIGLMQTAQDIGLPINKLFGVTPEKFNEASQRAVAGQNKLAEDTGISGAIVGGLADPLNLTPIGKLGKLALPAYGAVSGFTGGKSDDDGLAGRVGDAGVESALTYAGGKALEGGAKIASPIVRKAAEYIPDSVTNKASLAANYMAEKLKPSAVGPTVAKIKEGVRYGSVPKMSAQDIGEAVIKQKGNTAKTVSEFYDISRDLGRDISLSSKPFASKARSLLDGLPQDTFGTDRGAKIKEALTRFSKNDTVSAAELIDMEKNINKYWNRNADGKYDSLFEFKDLIQQKLDDIGGEETDLFKTAYNKAKQSHKDLNVARFDDNKITDKLLPERDFKNLSDFSRRKLTNNPSEIPDDTMQKLTQFVDKVTTPEEVNAALKMIPPEQRESFVKTALQQKMSKTRRGELITALKNTPWLVTPDWRRPVGAAMRVISPNLDDAGAISALKKLKKTGFDDVAFDKYQAELAKLKSGVTKKRASAQQLRDLADEMQPFSYGPTPPKPLALPSPAKAEPEYIKDAMGRVRLMTDEEKIAANVARKAQGFDYNTPKENMRIRGLNQKTYLEQNPDVAAFIERNKNAPRSFWEKLDLNNLEDYSPPAKSKALVPVSKPGEEASGIMTVNKKGEIKPATQNEINQNLLRARRIAEFKKAQGVPEGYAKGGSVKRSTRLLSNKLKDTLKRAPSDSETALATKIGVRGVSRLLKQTDLNKPAHKMFPLEIVSKYPDMFYDGKKPITIREMKANL